MAVPHVSRTASRPTAGTPDVIVAITPSAMVERPAGTNAARAAGATSAGGEHPTPGGEPGARAPAAGDRQREGGRDGHGRELRAPRDDGEQRRRSCTEPSSTSSMRRRSSAAFLVGQSLVADEVHAQ